MPPLHALAIFAAGIAAGGINTLVGSGTLITFPILLAFGYAPVTANVSNTIGLVPGSVAGAVGYRRELAGQRRRAIPFAVVSAIGATIGAILLLSLPPSAFKAIVPARDQRNVCAFFCKQTNGSSSCSSRRASHNHNFRKRHECSREGIKV